MNVALLLTNAYQVHHYRHLVPWLHTSPTLVVEVHNEDYGVDEAVIETYLPGLEVDWVPRTRLASLDGRFNIIVCQTPILPMRFLKRSRTVALQYSLAKERYQYGLWRSHVDLNLMYGQYSLDQVAPFCHARAVGNLLFDGLPDEVLPPVSAAERPRVLVLPTYGDLSALQAVLGRLDTAALDVVVKPHHRDAARLSSSLPEDVHVAPASADPIELVASADAVVSDFSGAAYDAVFCRRPVLLVGNVGAGLPDESRLSSNDLDRAHLVQLAVEWDAGTPFAEAYALAMARARDAVAYDRFRERFFVNCRSAGEAAAEAIAEVKTVSRSTHALGGLVNESLERHITANRRLRNEIKSLRGQNKRRASRRFGARVMSSVVRPEVAKRRIKHVAQRAAQASPLLGRIINRLVAARRRRSLRRQLAARTALREATATEHAEVAPDVAAELTRVLACRGVQLVASPLVRGRYAVLAKERKRVFEALQLIARDDPTLRLTLKLSERTRRVRNGRNLDRNEVLVALSLEIERQSLGSPIYGDGRLALHFVEKDERTLRMLALDRRDEHVDWTVDFMDRLHEYAEPYRRRVLETSQMSRGITQAGFTEPIDIVYTWVDSADAAWRARYARHSKQAHVVLESAANEERYADREELRYSLRSVERFAPFIRRIYIVTDGQRPPWLDPEHPRVQIVDHREIFPDESVLPVFNSHAIEACLHRIDGLSEHYLYMNDDFLFGNEVEPIDFFSPSGVMHVQLSPSQVVYDGEPTESAIPTDWASYRVKRLIESEFKYPVRHRLKHLAYAQRRSVAHEIERRYSVMVTATRAARFRSSADLAIPSMFLPYYALATQRAVAWPNVPRSYVYADTGRLNWFTRAKEMLRLRPRFICLNATRHTEIPLEAQFENVRSFLEAYFPHPSSMEFTRSGSESGRPMERRA